MDRNLVKLVVANHDDTGHVLAMKLSAVVYRRANVGPADPKYWRPNGEYYIIYGWYRLPVFYGSNGFELRLSKRKFLRLLYLNTTENLSGTTSEAVQRPKGRESQKPGGSEQATSR